MGGAGCREEERRGRGRKRGKKEKEEEGAKVMEGKKGMMVSAAREEMVHLSAVSPSLGPLPGQSCENVSRCFAAGNLAVGLSRCVDFPP